MAMYAYEDEARTKEIKAGEAVQKDRSIRYYCPNKRCPAKMFIWGLNGEKIPYFRSQGEPGHVEYCFGGSGNSYNPNDTDITDFDANDVIGRMMAPGKVKDEPENPKPKKGNGDGQVKMIVPHTIRQVYDMCKSYSCTDEINHQKVGYILFDERSAYMSPKGIFGKRLAEAKCRRYFYEGDSIFLETPINEEKYELELKIRDKKLFKKVKDMLYNNRNNVVVVAGDWQPSGTWNRFVTEFSTMSQIKILRQEI